MPPKRPINEEFVEALLDSRVVDALVKALGTKIAEIVESRLDDRFKDLLESINHLKVDSLKASKAIAALEADNKAMKTRLEELDAYSKCENLIFQGLPQSSFADAASASQTADDRRGERDNDESAGRLNAGGRRGGRGSGESVGFETSAASEATVISFVNTVLKVPLSAGDISVAHRLPKQRGDQRPAPLIVRFTNRRARNAVYAARKTLASHRPAVFINEHLTKDRSAIFREARLLVKNKKLQSAWTQNGAIFIKLSDLPDSRPIRVDSASDLPRG
jgi:hypothetical protein